jgi:hypothetical protein
MDAVRAFVAKHSDALELVEVAIEPDAQSGERVTRQKVRCRLTGHELPAKLDAIKVCWPLRAVPRRAALGG